jgi:hypothetical protein
MKAQPTTGILFILGALGVFIPYTLLTVTFDYPDILRKDAGLILTAFHNGGPGLIFTWWLFAILGLPMVAAYQQLGKQLAAHSPAAGWLTTIGIIGLVVQMIGLLRWVFVVPVLANNYVSGDETAREMAKALFQVVHQYGGVVLGEHLGQLFTIIWVVGITRILQAAQSAPRWLNGLGYAASAIYLMAQAELFATVIPSFPVWDPAGFIGSTLWLVWLVALGVVLLAPGRARSGARG